VNNQSFLDWLFSEAGAGWVFGIISFIGLLVSQWSKYRPKRRIAYNVRCVRGIDATWNFEIELRNKGSEPIEKPNIEIRLHRTAEILAYETEPSESPGYEVEARFDEKEPNVLHLLIPFVNSRQKLIVRLKSTRGAIPVCHVDVYALGVKTFARRPIHAVVLGFVWILAGFASMMLLSFLGKATWLPAWILDLFGATTVTSTIEVSVVEWPWILTAGLVTAYVVFLAVGSWMLLREVESLEGDRILTWSNLRRGIGGYEALDGSEDDRRA